MKSGTPGFIGDRLREAREARGLTGILLADQLRVTRQAVSQYETGQQSPSPEVMRRMTEVLRLPMHRFLRPKASRGAVGTIFYRSMATATKAPRVKAEARYKWLRDIEAYLRRYVKFPEVRFPDFKLPDDPRLLSIQQIEEYATKTRRFWGLGDGPISNVLWLVENNGAVVARFDLFAAKLDAFSEWSVDEPAPHIVLGADKGSAARSRFDVAHELAHIVLHRNVRATMLGQLSSFKLIESQADRFASAFLMPAESFANDLGNVTLDALVSLKSIWKTSVGAMIRRARHLDFLSQKGERNLWINLTRRGWRRNEPLDDVLEPEQPRLLRRSFNILIENRIVARSDIPYELALSASDIEDLVGLPSGYFEESLADGAARTPEPEAKTLRFPGT